MRVLQLIAANGYYGAESVVATLSAEFKGSVEDASIAVFNASGIPSDDLRRFRETSGVTIHDLRWNGRFDLVGLLRLIRLIHTAKIDVVHCHGYKADTIGYLATLVSKAKLVATCHNWTNSTSGLSRNFKLDLLVLRYFDKVVAVSETVLSTLKANGVRAERLIQIDNGVDIGTFSVQPKPPSRENAFVIGAVARLSIEKGLDVLLAALPQIAARYPHVICRIIGEGAERERLAGMAERLRISQLCHFEGFCSDVPGFLRDCTLIVMPSRTEGMPIAALEAMAAKTPVIATRVGSMSRLLLEGRAGVLIPVDSPDAIADAVHTLLADSAVREQLAACAYEHVCERFSTARMATRYVNLYRELGREAATVPAAETH